MLKTVKIIFISIIIIGLSLPLHSQHYFDAIDTGSESSSQDYKTNNSSITIGILNGGGSLIGADFEFLVSKHIGLQLGAGWVGFGGGVNYHFKPSIRSSFISFQYYNQGIGDSFAQNAIGSTFVFRGKKWLTFQIGLGIPLRKGPAMPANYELPPVMALYSIGAYFPL